MANIRPLLDKDYNEWLTLWNDNNQGHSNDEVTKQTWSRLTSSNEQVFGLGAFEDDALVGLLHYILHPVTGHIKPVCYMQDLYVDETKRRKGIAKLLIADLAKRGQEQAWPRIYWLAEENNIAAQKLYKNLGLKLNFSLHVLPLQTS